MNRRSSTEPAGHLTSPQNPRVLAARKLLRRAQRDRDRAFLVEGPNVIGEAFAAGLEVRDLFVNERVFEERTVTAPASEAGVRVWVVGDDILALITDRTTPQGAVAVATDPSQPLDAVAEHDLVLVLASIRDPGNAGTLVRSAVGAGAGGVIFTTGTVDPLGPKVVRSSAGALFHVDVARAVDLADAVAAMKRSGSKVVGSDARSGTAPEDVDLTGPAALVVGNESWGLPDDQARLLDASIGIPMPGPAESLNVSVAGSILLFEAVRQRRRASSSRR